jgi:predicted nucleic acid-binding protein
MIVYVDTSVVLRILLHEPNPLGIWGKWNKAYSSALWRVEALRTIDRLRLTHEISDAEVADLVRDIQITPLSTRSRTMFFREQAKPFPLSREHCMLFI